jgi:hypothetical protein
VIARSFVLNIPNLAPDIVALPVRTPLVRSGDDLPRILARSLAGLLRADDVICVSETAVAIAQGRSIRAETIRPSKLARLLAQRAGPYATVNQPESMQLVLESAGTLRVLAAAAAGAAGRVMGRRGDFYRILGPAIAEIDGYTGTMPPYERHIVLGPKDPQAAAVRIAEICGARACVVDANDLGKAEVLGVSGGVNVDAVRACLCTNPAGNADEQTPVVILKYRPRPGSFAPSPLLEQW